MTRAFCAILLLITFALQAAASEPMKEDTTLLKAAQSLAASFKVGLIIACKNADFDKKVQLDTGGKKQDALLKELSEKTALEWRIEKGFLIIGEKKPLMTRQQAIQALEECLARLGATPSGASPTGSSDPVDQIDPGLLNDLQNLAQKLQNVEFTQLSAQDQLTIRKFIQFNRNQAQALFLRQTLVEMKLSAPPK